MPERKHFIHFYTKFFAVSQIVLEAAGELDYAATKSRRGRAPKSLLRVGLAEMLTPQEQLRDPYYLYLRKLTEQACVEQRLTAVPLLRKDATFLPPEGGAVDGVAAIGIFTQEQIASLKKISDTVVFLDSSPDETGADAVVVNYRLGINLALAYLEALGHSSPPARPAPPRFCVPTRKTPSAHIAPFSGRG